MVPKGWVTILMGNSAVALRTASRTSDPGVTIEFRYIGPTITIKP
ncbi:hypothetical protein BpOF4_21704 (plasmid) [Alkalihalophilus pseudofirmus OF4]|uniref:Uncharacterized protein n=1 Tax=Alkalihalophilus pseudofirmus (strain ATCC BAA-2126 / JCM 17055 / OF4) TaxID=398511 RepID=D3G1W0_ALKPO|nr:hypothetical protein [Alkalihalophilus pseudofirmus]ADC52336.1 hypothetical protein BpOF4_21704 [Alkalihalophilus pseudofirmus OF4]